MSAPRAMWKGFIQVQVLHVPVKLYSAVRSQRVPFRMLHDQDLAPVNQRLWCPVEEKIVPREKWYLRDAAVAAKDNAAAST